VDDRRARVHEDLRGAVQGDLAVEAVARGAYAVDGGPHECDPLAVVAPRSLDDVEAVVRYAAENAAPLHARGAGSAGTGGAIGPGIVLDFSRYFRRVVSIDHDRVTVQPGATLDELNARLAPLGRRVGPDPWRSDVTTIGGMVGRDAAGPCALRYGATADHLERLSVVFAGGETAELGRELWPGFDDDPADLKGLIVRKLGTLVRRNLDLLVQRAPRNRAGYALARAASGAGVHLPRLIAGSLGTLAIVTEVTIRTVPIPAAQAAVLLPFARTGDAAAAALESLDASPAACELFDWRLIRLARELSPRHREWISDEAEAVLVLLFEGDGSDETSARAGRIAGRVARAGRVVADPVLATRRADCDAMLGIRRAVEAPLMRMRGRARPIDAIGEVCVPPDRLPEMLQRLQVVMKDRGVSWAVHAHAGDGRLHPRPFLDLADPADRARLEPLAVEVYEAAIELGGWGPNDLGPAAPRGPIRRRQLGDLLPLFQGIKDAFDPQGLLNPGLLVGDESVEAARSLVAAPPPPAPKPAAGSSEFELTALPAELRDEEARPTSPTVHLPVLRWGEGGPVATASQCNGCGVCRSRESTSRMCPTFRALRSEGASPRARANLVRQIAAGRLEPALWGSEEFQESARLCTFCKMCPTECPSGVDVASLMVEAKAAYVETHGLPPGAWAMSRVELAARVASRLPILCNALLASRPARWLLERLIGLSRLRRLPRAHRTPFVRRAARLGLTRPRPHEPGPRVAYFVDVYANHFDQELAESVVGVLREAGVNVYVPPRQRGSGMPALVAGDVEYARERALANLRVLGDAVRDGYSVVCSEPTAALMIRDEYLKLTDDLDAALVAANTHDVGHYLSGLDARGQLPPPEQPLRVRVGYHQPCHLRALNVGTPGLELIRRIPEIEVEFIDRGCSGMAGTFGLHRDNFLTSLRSGRGLLNRLRDGDLDLGSTECGACRIQMEQGAPKWTLHPIKLLSLAYGQNPALRRRIKEAKPRRRVF
jgi:FAD/FMN-containing dehydrogenase/Fe-S oxidoreductase